MPTPPKGRVILNEENSAEEDFRAFERNIAFKKWRTRCFEKCHTISFTCTYVKEQAVDFICNRDTNTFSIKVRLSDGDIFVYAHVEYNRDLEEVSTAFEKYSAKAEYKKLVRSIPSFRAYKKEWKEEYKKKKDDWVRPSLAFDDAFAAIRFESPEYPLNQYLCTITPKQKTGMYKNVSKRYHVEDKGWCWTSEPKEGDVEMCVTKKEYHLF
jgi:hypothetical protein